MMAGGALGLLVLDRLLPRFPPRRLLAAASLACVLLYGAYLAAPNVLVVALLAPLLGAAISWQYPLAQAQAYRAAPGHANLVNAIESFMEPALAATPLLLAWVHDRLGGSTALAVLALQPLVLLVLSIADRRK
jgi:fucose permease